MNSIQISLSAESAAELGFLVHRRFEATVEGSVACTQCGLGRFANTTGTTYCAYCSPGSVLT
jgi:hypothetical protein